jgi:hypothetical protein
MPIIPNTYTPQSRKEKIVYYGIIATIMIVIGGILFYSIVGVCLTYNGTYTKYVTAVGEKSVWLAPLTDSNPGPYGNFTLADGVVVPEQVAKDGCGWVDVTLEWGVITKIEECP